MIEFHRNSLDNTLAQMARPGRYITIAAEDVQFIRSLREQVQSYLDIRDAAAGCSDGENIAQ